MILSSFLIFIAISHRVYGLVSSNGQYYVRDEANDEFVEDAVSDLHWINSDSPRNVLLTDDLSNQKLIEISSANNLHSMLTDGIENNYYEDIKQPVPQYDSSHLLVNIIPGRRRLDHENAAQFPANKFIVLDTINEPHLSNGITRLNQPIQSQINNKGYYPDILSNNHYHNYNRKSSIDMNNQKIIRDQIQRRQQSTINTSLSNGQESRKKFTRPLVGVKTKVYRSNIFNNDDKIDKPLDRKFDFGDNDENDNDDDDDNNDKNKPGFRSRSNIYGKLKTTPIPDRQQHDRGNDLSSRSEKNEADEEIDSSNMKELTLSQGVIQNIEGLRNKHVDTKDDEASSISRFKHGSSDLQTAAGHHHDHNDHYYQYVEVPKKKAWKFGFKRGSHKHTIERHEKGYKNNFHSSFKWHAKEKCKKKDKCESKGKMTWDYQHHDKKHHG